MLELWLARINANPVYEPRQPNALEASPTTDASSHLGMPGEARTSALLQLAWIAA